MDKWSLKVAKVDFFQREMKVILSPFSYSDFRFFDQILSSRNGSIVNELFRTGLHIMHKEGLANKPVYADQVALLFC